MGIKPVALDSLTFAPNKHFKEPEAPKLIWYQGIINNFKQEHADLLQISNKTLKWKILNSEFNFSFLNNDYMNFKKFVIYI